MHGSALQWGGAARCSHPLLVMLNDSPHDAQEAGEVIRIDKPFAHPSCVTAVAVAADGTTVSADDQGRLKLWRLCVAPPAAKLDLVATHVLHTGAVTCLELHGLLLATAGDDGYLRLWLLPRLLQCASGRPAPGQLTCLSAHGGSVAACCFTSCGRFLASAGVDGTVRLWNVAAREPLAVLQLSASSVAFALGDNAALLVAATGLDSAAGPQLLDLRRVPACRQFCRQLAGGSGGGLSSSTSLQAQRRHGPGQLVAPDPATAVWPPTASPGSAASPSAAVASRQAAPGSGGSARRQVGSLATYGRRRRRRQEEAAAADELEEAGEAVSASGASSGWLPGRSTPQQQRARGWLSPLSPSSPQAREQDDGCVPGASVLARYAAAASSSGSEWDADTQTFVYRQGGHRAPVLWAGLTPAGLHVLTTSADGESKLWAADGDGICCTLLPPAHDPGSDCCLPCRPAGAPCGRFVVCGGPSGSVAVWDLEQLQRTAYLPLQAGRGNAAAVAKVHGSPVTAVAVAAGAAAAGGWMLLAGDAAGRLHVRLR